MKNSRLYFENRDFFEIEKPHGDCPPHFGLDLLFANFKKKYHRGLSSNSARCKDALHELFSDYLSLLVYVQHTAIISQEGYSVA